MNRNPYPSDVSDEERAFVAPYLTLMREDAPQREYSLREVFNGSRSIAKTRAQWRMTPNDLLPWHAVYRQTQRWFKAGVFEAIMHDVRMLLREIADRAPQPTAAIFDGRTLQSSPERGERAADDSATRRNGSKVHAAVDALGHSLALPVTPANEQDCAQAAELAAQVQEVTSQMVEAAFVDQGSTGEQASEAATAEGMRLEIIKPSEAKRGFVLLPRRWVIERSFTRFRHLVRNDERLPETLAGVHFLSFAVLLLSRFVRLMDESA